MAATSIQDSSWRKSLVRRYREFALIARDSALLIGLLVAGIFVIIFVFAPILRVIGRGFVDSDGAFSLEYFARYVDPYYAATSWRSLHNTLSLGFLSASGGTIASKFYIFRTVTLPLITPALLARLIFSFTRHMTSLSAIIFLVSPRWRIVTASILSEWEQGDVSFAAAYATVIIVLVLIAIGILYFVTHRILGGRGDVDLSLDVLSRKLSERRWQRIQPVLGTLLSMAMFVPIYFSWRPSSPDPGDEHIIDCAMNVGAMVVTSNIRDFQVAKQALGLQVMTPVEFIRQLAD